MNREDELFIAKKTAERAGYKVSRPVNVLAAAKNTAERAGYRVVPNVAPQPRIVTSKPVAPAKSFATKEIDRIAAAAHTAERAGYKVFKKPTNTVKNDREDTSWIQGATKFLKPEE